MSVRPLKSDQVNYLIWRYLQESGHAQTAARLQLDWGRTDPQRLPFAQHIRTHALVHLLQKGLRYHELETSIDQSGNRKSPSFFFGSEIEAVTPEETGNADDDASTTSRKHQRDSISNEADLHSQAPSAKRSRRAAGGQINGSNQGRPDGEGMELDPAGSADLAAAKREPGPATSATSPASTTANNASLPPNSEMDLDPTTKPTSDSNSTNFGPNAHGPEGATEASIKSRQDGENSDAGDAYPQNDAAAGVEPPTINIVPTLVNGSSVGVQSDKVTELGPETGVLVVPGQNVTHALWSPRNPGALAAAGDALCRLWSMPTTFNTTNNNPVANGLTKPSEPKSIEPTATIDLNEERGAYVVDSMAWNDEGTLLAVAKHCRPSLKSGVIDLYDSNGVCITELDASEDVVLKLMWNPSSLLILGICQSRDDASRLKVWDVKNGVVLTLPLGQNPVFDATWIDERHFYLCKHNYVAKAEAQENNIALVNERLAEQLPGAWSQIAYDKHTNSTALAAEGSPANIGLLAGSGWVGLKEAHSGDVTLIAFQPLTSSAAAAVRSGQNGARILASSSMDGTIKLWNIASQLELVHELDMGNAHPVLAMSFTPDGYLVAGASADKVLVWNAEVGGSPKASWPGRDAGWLTNGDAHVNGNGHSAENGDVEMSDNEEQDLVPTLGWDADGKKLVCALRNQLAIISMRR